MFGEALIPLDNGMQKLSLPQSLALDIYNPVADRASARIN